MTEENILAYLIIIVPIVFGYMLPTIIDRLIKRHEEKHKCKHIHTEWCNEPPSKFMCISGVRVIKVCKDCGKVIDDMFFEHEGMGYK
jgi:hypothetical protein